MDRFKFRVWDDNAGQYCFDFDRKYHAGFMLTSCGKLIFTDGGDYDISEDYSDMAIEQCTGLKDKNGKLIYEGDLLKAVALFNDHGQRGAITIGSVASFMGNSCFCLHGNESGPPIYPFNVGHTIEIIGNMHEEKDLLGGSNG